MVIEIPINTQGNKLSHSPISKVATQNVATKKKSLRDERKN